MKKKEIKPLHIFILAGGLFILVYGIACFFNQSLYTVIFQGDLEDAFMDYFNSVSHSIGRKPYAIKAIYPPLCYVFYWIMGIFMGDGAMEILSQHDESQKFLREMSQPIMVFLIYFSVSLVLFLYLGRKLLKRAGKDAALFLALICLSCPFLFQFERANIIFISLLGTMAFFAWIDSDNQYLREAALIALALSAALKIYPAIFGLLLIKEKRYKEAVRLVIYGILCFFLPFLFIRGGFSTIPQFIKNLIYTSTIDQAQRDGYKLSFSAITSYLLRNAAGDTLLAEKIGEKIAIMIAAAGLFAFPWIKERWKSVLLLSCLLIGIPNMSYTYTAIFLVVPLILFLNEEQGKYRRLFLLLFIFVFFPLPFGGWNEHNGLINYYLYNRSFNTIQISGAILAITLLLCGEGLFLFFKKEKTNAKAKNVLASAALVCLAAVCLYGVRGSYASAKREQDKVTAISEGTIKKQEIYFNDRSYTGTYTGHMKKSKPYGKGQVCMNSKDEEIKIEGIWDDASVSGDVTVTYPNGSYATMTCCESQIYGYVTTYDEAGVQIGKEWYYDRQNISKIENSAYNVSYEEMQDIFYLEPNAVFECSGTVTKIVQDYNIAKVTVMDSNKNKYTFSYQNLGINPWDCPKCPNLKKNDTIKWYAGIDEIKKGSIKMFLKSAYILKDGQIEQPLLDSSYEDILRYPGEYLGSEMTLNGKVIKIKMDFDNNSLLYFLENAEKETFIVNIGLERVFPSEYQISDMEKKEIVNRVKESLPGKGDKISVKEYLSGNYICYEESQKGRISAYPQVYKKANLTEDGDYILANMYALP